MISLKLGTCRNSVWQKTRRHLQTKWRQNWIFFDGGRWNMQSAPLGTFSEIASPSPNTKTFLLRLGKPQLTARTDLPSSDVQALVEKIQAENWLERCIPCVDPNWIAGRMWEQLCPTMPSEFALQRLIGCDFLHERNSLYQPRIIGDNDSRGALFSMALDYISVPAVKL